MGFAGLAKLTHCRVRRKTAACMRGVSRLVLGTVAVRCVALWVRGKGVQRVTEASPTLRERLPASLPPSPPVPTSSYSNKSKNKKVDKISIINSVSSIFDVPGCCLVPFSFFGTHVNEQTEIPPQPHSLPQDTQAPRTAASNQARPTATHPSHTSLLLARFPPGQMLTPCCCHGPS